MSSWGLSSDFLDRLASGEVDAPWGLHPDLLQPAKVIRDPIEKDIGVTELERWFIDSPPLQRLRGARQLGTTHYVYPGATHTRFSHSLGTIKAAQKLLDSILEQRHHPHAVDDLFKEWYAEADQGQFELRVAEVTVLARLGALLHDITHLPYGHSVEDDLGILEAHDKNTWRFEQLWDQISDFLEQRLTSKKERPLYESLRDNALNSESRLYKSLRPLILSKEVDATGKDLPPAHERMLEYPFVADLVGNTICADLLDYLARDHLYTGLPMELGDRFLSAFFVTPSGRARYARRMALSIVRADRERTDVISELLKHLRYRYEQTERVLTHHAKLAADAMVGKALEMWRDHIENDGEPGRGVAKDYARRGPLPKERGAADRRKGSASKVVALPKGRGTAKHAARRNDPENGEGADRKTAKHREKASPASRKIEAEMLKRSDDGLLEYLRDYVVKELEANPPAVGRLEALRTLIDGLLERDLYKGIDRVSTQQGSAEILYEDFGSPADRRQLEQSAARYAGMEDAWKLLLWIPPPEMRLKVAEVLVYDGSEISAFAQSEAYRNKRGMDIYESHRRLWGISLFAHRSVARAQHEAARAFLAREMEVRWDRMVEEFGRDATVWPDKLAIRYALERQKKVPRDFESQLLDVDKVARRPAGAEETHDGMVAHYERLAEANLPA